MAIMDLKAEKISLDFSEIQKEEIAKSTLIIYSRYALPNFTICGCGSRFRVYHNNRSSRALKHVAKSGGCEFPNSIRYEAIEAPIINFLASFINKKCKTLNYEKFSELELILNRNVDPNTMPLEEKVKFMNIFRTDDQRYITLRKGDSKNIEVIISGIVEKSFSFEAPLYIPDPRNLLNEVERAGYMTVHIIARKTGLSEVIIQKLAKDGLLDKFLVGEEEFKKFASVTKNIKYIFKKENFDLIKSEIKEQMMIRQERWRNNLLGRRKKRDSPVEGIKQNMGAYKPTNFSMIEGYGYVSLFSVTKFLGTTYRELWTAIKEHKEIDELIHPVRIIMEEFKMKSNPFRSTNYVVKIRDTNRLRDLFQTLVRHKNIDCKIESEGEIMLNPIAERRLAYINNDPLEDENESFTIPLDGIKLRISKYATKKYIEAYKLNGFGDNEIKDVSAILSERIQTIKSYLNTKLDIGVKQYTFFIKAGTIKNIIINRNCDSYKMDRRVKV